MKSTIAYKARKRVSGLGAASQGGEELMILNWVVSERAQIGR